MLRNKLIVFLILASVLSLFVYAEDDFSVELTPVKDRIFPNESAVFTLKVTTNMPIIEYFSIYSPDVRWSITTDPAKDINSLKVYPFSSSSTTLLIKPTADIKSGQPYAVSIRVRGTRSEEMVKDDKSSVIYIKSPKPFVGEYLPTIKAQVEMNDEIDPREDVRIRLSLQNMNPRNLTQLKIKLRSYIIKKDYPTTLGPMETKTLEFTIRLDPLEPPRKDTLYVTASTEVGNKTYSFEAEPKNFEIVSYGSIEEDIQEEVGFLKNKRYTTLKNIGNINREELFKVETSFIRKLFTSTKPAATKATEGGVNYLVWSVSLEPEETTKIIVTVNYQPLFFSILVILMIVVAYYILRSPVIITKSARIIGTKDGGISNINIQLDVKNRSGKAFNDVKIIDKVSNLIEVQKEFRIGTLQPSKILKHDKKGTILKWEISEMDKYEERVITYKAKARLSILGEFSLPNAVLKFRDEKGNLKAVSSRRVRIISG